MMPKSFLSLVASARPVMAKDAIIDLAKHVIGMSTADHASIRITHTAQTITRTANGQVLSGDDGDEVALSFDAGFGEGTSGLAMSMSSNQLNDALLRDMVRRCEAIARERSGNPEFWFPDRPIVQDELPVVELWHDETTRAMASARATVLPDVINTVSRANLRATGFVGFRAAVHAVYSKGGNIGAYEDTDSELTVTARSLDGQSSGWAGRAARNWATIRPVEVAQEAVEWAQRNANPVAVEPGRRTAILGPAAVAQVMRWMAPQFDAGDTDEGRTGFSRDPRGNKRGQRMFDPRIMMRSDPNDPEGGYSPYIGAGLRNPAMTWVENGILQNLAYSPQYGMQRGKPYAGQPFSMRMAGSTTSVEEMIAQCQEGIYVNRFSNVAQVDPKSCLLSGVTRDGCLLIKNGKIVKAAKNFRFLDSPFFFLNSVVAIGPTRRAAFGYTPPSFAERGWTDWPRPPMIMPTIMVRDFNFVGIADAV